MDKEKELKKVVATPFKKKNEEEMKEKSFIFSLALDLNWFSLEEAKDIVSMAISKNYLLKKNDSLVPNFTLEEIDSSLSFKPNRDFLDEIEKESNSLLDQVINKIQKDKDLTKQEIISKSNNVQNELFKLIDVEVASLLVAKESGVSVDDLIDEKLKEL